MKLIATILFILSSIASSFSQEASDSINQKIDSINRKTDSINRKTNLINQKTGRGKTNTYVIEYDFKSGYFKTNNQRIIVNSPVVFKITNINRLAYDVTVKAKDSVIGMSEMEGAYEMFKNEQIKKLEDQIKTSDINKANFQPITADVAEDFKGSPKETKELKKAVNNFITELSIS